MLEELQAYRKGFESIVWAPFDPEGDSQLAGPTFSNEDDVPDIVMVSDTGTPGLSVLLSNP